MKSYIWTAVISFVVGGGLVYIRYYKIIEAGKNALAVIEGGIQKVENAVKRVR